MDKATLWPYDIGVTLASRSSHQSQLLKLSTWRYGYMRLTTSDINFIKMSYFIEALCTANELYYTNDIHTNKALFVIIISLLFGIVI